MTDQWGDIVRAVAVTRPLRFAFTRARNNPEALIAKLARRPDLAQINVGELTEIAITKLAGMQAADQVQASIESNDPDKVKRASRSALAAHAATAAIAPLSELNGVGVAVASAVVAWCKPGQWPVIDKHAWNTLSAFDLVNPRRHPTSFYEEEYDAYCAIMVPLAARVEMPVQQLDRWAYAFSKCGLQPEHCRD